MSDLYRFDVDYIDEERGSKRIECEDGDYVLAEDALKLRAEVERYRDAIDKHQRYIIDKLSVMKFPSYPPEDKKLWATLKPTESNDAAQ